MKKHILLLLLSQISNLKSQISFAQNPEIKRTNHWYFGQNAGLDFSNDTVVVDTNGAYNNYEAAATMSDTAGNLLFYTDAETVWNRNHQEMPNGSSIGGCWSSTQGALIVPLPDNDSIYYIFTTDCAENNLVNGLRYSIVNMNLDSGRGVVIQKNILLHAPVAEKLAGVHHSNGKDVWVVTHEWNSDKFFAYIVTAQGIDTLPVISSVGSVHSGLTYNEDAGGYLKISPNGKKIACVKFTNNSVELFEFDNTKGFINNPIVLATAINIWSYGAAFSPDNSKLYISYQSDQALTLGGRLYQYNLFGGASDIITSKILIYSSSNYHFHALQNGKDGKIYIAEAYFQTDNGNIVGVINNPNELGILCDFVQSGVYLLGKYSRRGLPNFIESYFNCDTCKTDTVSVDKIFSKNDKIFIFPNPASNEINIASQSNILKTIITDIHGRSVIEKAYTFYSNEIKLNTSILPSGFYNLYIQTEQNIFIKKLVLIQ